MIAHLSDLLGYGQELPKKKVYNNIPKINPEEINYLNRHTMSKKLAY